MVALSGTFYVASGLTDIKASIERIHVMADQPAEMRSTWKDAVGITWSVVTYRNAGESNAAWAQRHTDSTAALAALHPPVP